MLPVWNMFWIKSSLKKTHFFVQCVNFSQGSSLCSSSTIILIISEKMKTLILAATFFSNWQKNSCILSDIFISISKFLFGTTKLIYQINALGVVGGVLGWILWWNFITTMLIFQHKLSNKSNNADNSAYMLKIQQHQYHKLKNCRPSDPKTWLTRGAKWPFRCLD